MKRAASRKRKSPAKVATTLAQQVIAAPRTLAPKEAKARVAQWVAEIGRTQSGKSVKRLIDASSRVEALLIGLSDGSPFLWDLIVADPARLISILESDPESHLTSLLAETAGAVSRARSEGEAMRLL